MVTEQLNPWREADVSRALAVLRAARAADMLTPNEAAAVASVLGRASVRLGGNAATTACGLAGRLMARSPAPSPARPLRPTPNKQEHHKPVLVDAAAVYRERAKILAAARGWGIIR